MSSMCAVCALAVLTGATVPAVSQWEYLDRFDRPDGPIVPIDGWTQHTDPLYFEVVSNEAMSRLGSNALMTYDAYTGPIRFDVHHSGDPTITESASAILGLLDSDNYLEIRLVSNAGWDTFHSVLFRYVDDGVVNNGWPGIDPPSWFVFLGDSAFSDAQITASLVDDVVRLEINTFGGGPVFTNEMSETFGSGPAFIDEIPPTLVLERGGAPVGDLGTGVGLGASGAAKIDDFQGIPEPGSAMLFMVLSGAAVWAMRSRQGRVA